MLLSAEMLNMLNMSNVFGPMRLLQFNRNFGPQAQLIQHFSTKKTLPQKGLLSAEMLNMLNHVGSKVPKKNAFFC